MGVNMSTITVAVTWKAVRGSYWNPSHNATPIVTTSMANRPTYGERNRRLRAAKAPGSNRMRPIAYRLRPDELLAAFRLAIAELSRARKTIRNPKPPQAFRASRFCHGLSFPAWTKFTIRLGPKKTVLA